jgi:ketosteroid isomerase-like protein
MTNLATVQYIYEAFGRGDIPGILERISDDCKWESWPDNHLQAAGVAYFEARRGKAGAAAFFGSLAAIELHDFQVHAFLDGGRQVGVVCEIEFTVKETGRRLRDQEVHLWWLDERGQVAMMRHYVDTHKHLWANGKV